MGSLVATRRDQRLIGIDFEPEDDGDQEQGDIKLSNLTERQDGMSHFEMTSFLDRVDSIQSRLMESLITGQKDPIFARPQPQPKLKPEPNGQSLSDSNSKKV